MFTLDERTFGGNKTELSNVEGLPSSSRKESDDMAVCQGFCALGSCSHSQGRGTWLRLFFFFNNGSHHELAQLMA